MTIAERKQRELCYVSSDAVSQFILKRLAPSEGENNLIVVLSQVIYVK